MISFGICCAPNANQDHLAILIESIINELIWNTSIRERFEIILCGAAEVIERYKTGPVRLLPFDETEKTGWITRKKNLIAQAAFGDNLVLMHDYYKLEKGWHKGWCNFDNFYEGRWKVAMNRILTKEGERHSDWIVHPEYLDTLCKQVSWVADALMKAAPHENHPKYVCGLPYYVTDMTHLQYISGGYMIVKRDFFLEHPMNESLAWGDAEDLEWSHIALPWNKYEGHPPMDPILYFNPASKVSVQKEKKWRVYQMPYEVQVELRQKYGRFDPVQ